MVNSNPEGQVIFLPAFLIFWAFRQAVGLRNTKRYSLIDNSASYQQDNAIENFIKLSTALKGLFHNLKYINI